MHLARSASYYKSVRVSSLYDSSAANFSDSKNPPQDPKSPFLNAPENEPPKQKEGSKKTAFGQGSKKEGDRHHKGSQGKEEGEKRIFHSKGAFQKKEHGRREEKAEEGAAHEEHTESLEEGSKKGFALRGGDRQKGFKGQRPKEGEEEKLAAKPRIAFQKRDKERAPVQRSEEEGIDEDYFDPQENIPAEETRGEGIEDRIRSLARGEGPKKTFKGGMKQTKAPMFGSKEVNPGFVLSKMNVEIESEVDTAAQEITPEQREAVLTRIASVKQLENTPKKYQTLMELYLLVNQPAEAQQVYVENQDTKLKKDMVIENLMFEACIKESYEKAQQFYAYLKKEGKLEEVFSNHMAKYIELQTSSAPFEELRETLDDLRSINYNIGTLDISVFNTFLGFTRNVNETEFVKNLRPKQAHDFVRKSEIFVDYLREILRKKPAQIESFPYQFRFTYFFKVLNELNYPKIKLDSNGLDICMGFLEVLAGSNLLNFKTIDFADLAKWIAIYFEIPEAWPRAHYILSSIPQDEEFFPHFLRELNNYVAEKGVAPFDADHVRDQYVALKEHIAKSKKYLSTESVRVILELAQAHKQYDIIFDIYENYAGLVQKKEVPLFLYVYLMNTFTHLKLTTKNAINIVRKLKDEYEQKYGGFPTTLDAFLQVKALIKDGSYQDAHIIFEKKILQGIVPAFQKTLIFTYLAMMFVMEDNGETRSYQDLEDDDMFMLKEFVNELTDKDLLEMFKKLEDDNICVYDIAGAEDIDEHLRYWDNIIQNPEQRRQELKEYRLKVHDEYLNLVEKRKEELRLLRNPKAIPNEVPEVDPEIERELNINESNWEFEEYSIEDLETDELLGLLARAFTDREEIKKLIKLPLEKPKVEKNTFTLSRAREEYNKPILQLIDDLMLWGVSTNEPLGKHILFLFFKF